MSGFHVDPGFKGKIKFSVYNAGPAPITMDRDKPYFLIWFSQLTSKVSKPYSGSHEGQNKIDDNDVNDLKGELASPNKLLSSIQKVRTELNLVYAALGILIAIVTTMAIAFYNKENDFEAGYKLRLNEERLSKKVDSLSKIKVDSIIKSNRKSKDSPSFTIPFKINRDSAKSN